VKKTNLILVVSLIAFLLTGSAVLAQDPPQETPDIVYDLDHVRPDVTSPKPIYTPNPEYTDRARKKKIRGSVVLSIVITDKGLVRDAKVVTGLDKDLDKQALKAVGSWRFEPATKDGKPVAVRVKVEADFKLY
jgi:periplasmic protein TonB